MSLLLRARRMTGFALVLPQFVFLCVRPGVGIGPARRIFAHPDQLA